ncbi:MarR family winged helix-turn-helix transcriptional regulator [Endothiovibrio diazotrophicus]
MNALARRVNRVWEEAFRDHGLSPAQGYLLRAVLEQPGISHKGLAEQLALEKSTVTRLVNALERHGLVSREPGDGREIGITPTDTARELDEELDARIKQLNKTLRKRLGKRETRELVKQLRALAEQFDAKS